MSKAVKKKKTLSDARQQPQMKLVLSDVCEVCPTPCPRGLAYSARMKEPGAMGAGVPCVLTIPGRK
jgi:hypothetical protein